MTRLILVGWLMTCFCLLVQTLAGAAALRLSEARRVDRYGHMRLFVHLSSALGILFLGIVVQMAAWAAAWRMLGEFSGFEEALYFSGVTFTSLGYGDIVIRSENRILAPLEATTGLIMFAVLTAVFIQVMHREGARRRGDPPPGG